MLLALVGNLAHQDLRLCNTRGYDQFRLGQLPGDYLQQLAKWESNGKSTLIGPARMRPNNTGPVVWGAAGPMGSTHSITDPPGAPGVVSRGS